MATPTKNSPKIVGRLRPPVDRFAPGGLRLHFGDQTDSPLRREAVISYTLTLWVKFASIYRL